MYIYTYIHIYIDTYMHICIYTYTHACGRDDPVRRCRLPRRLLGVANTADLRTKIPDFRGFDSSKSLIYIATSMNCDMFVLEGV